MAGRGTQATERRVLKRAFASGRRAKAQCPICGTVHPYQTLVQDWRGVWVCPDCWDPRDPQETILSVADAEILDHPAPLLDQPPDNSVELTDEDGFASTFGAAGARTP